MVAAPLHTVDSQLTQIDIGADSLHLRVWQPGEGTFRATIIMLHGVVSHSLWLEPIALGLAQQGFRVVCPDRRGAGMNELGRGDSESGEQLLCDLGQIVQAFSEVGKPHLCGVCWGGNYAINYLGAHAASVASISLLAPAVFPASALREATIVVSDSAEATETPIVSIEGFTQGPAYQAFIVPDPLRLKQVSPRFNGIMQSFSSKIGLKFLKLELPLLVILAEDDQLSDNGMMQKMFPRVRSPVKTLASVPGEHGLQFDAPAQTVRLVEDWIDSLESAVESG